VTAKLAIFSYLFWRYDDFSYALLNLGLLQSHIERGSSDPEIEIYLAHGTISMKSNFYKVISKFLRKVLCRKFILLWKLYPDYRTQKTNRFATALTAPLDAFKITNRSQKNTL
jgi:hypothetical protein